MRAHTALQRLLEEFSALLLAHFVLERAKSEVARLATEQARADEERCESRLQNTKKRDLILWL